MIKYGMALVGQSVTANEISKLQRRAGINVTGVLDTETKKLLLIPRCGVREDDYKDQEYGTKRKKRFTLQGSTWNKRVSVAAQDTETGNHDSERASPLYPCNGVSSDQFIFRSILPRTLTVNYVSQTNQAAKTGD